MNQLFSPNNLMDLTNTEVDKIKIIENIKKDTDEFMGKYATLNKENAMLVALKKKTLLKDFTKADILISPDEENINIDKIKFALFGRTSSGKSAVINAIIGKKIMPTSKGRTTSCFVSLKGHCEERRLLIDNQGNEHPIELLDTLANEMNPNKAMRDSLINVLLPISQYPIFNSDNELFDTPGIDSTHSTDNFVMKYFKGEDIFIYVIDAESNLGLSDREFFKSLKNHFKSPLILILINKWDRCDDEENIEDLKKQHLDMIKTTLTEDLRDFRDPTEITFFISATEELNQYKGHTTILKTQRKNEFERFIGVLQSLFSKSALRGRHKQNIDRYSEYLTRLINNINIDIDIPEKGPEEQLKNSICELIKTTFIDINNNVQERVTERFSEFSFNNNGTNNKGPNMSIDDIIKDILESTAFVELDELSNQIRVKMMSVCEQIISTDNKKSYDLIVPRETETIHLEKPCSDNDKYCQWRYLLTESSSKYKYSAGFISLAICFIIRIHNFINPVKKEKEKLEQQLRADIIKSILKTLKDCQNSFEKDAMMKMDLFVKDYQDFCDFVNILNKLRTKLSDR